MFITRGNHESEFMNKIYGFLEECRVKCSVDFSYLANEVMNYMHFAHVIQKKIFVVHGGLPKKADFMVDDLRGCFRVYDPEPGDLLCDLFWSDPSEMLGVSATMSRDCGHYFGPDITKAFLARNGLDLIIRSHETKPYGHESQHDGKCITIFSAPNYK